MQVYKIINVFLVFNLINSIILSHNIRKVFQ
nr:MAG TPA: hypothetical protein [Caudoviricetes sp.]